MLKPQIRYSICIPVRNTKKYIKCCLESVFNQVYTNYEVIIVDNGSTDGSSELLDLYAEKYPNIKVIHQKDQGLLNSRRRAIEESTGDYLCFLDSDDYWREDYLSKCTAIITENNCDIVSFSYSIEDSKGITQQRLYDSEGELSYEDYIKHVFSHSILNNLWLKVIKRELFDMDENALYRTMGNVVRVEGAIQTLEILKRESKIYVTNEALYVYRIMGQGLMAKGALNLYKELKIEYEYFSRSNLFSDLRYKDAVVNRQAHCLVNIFTVIRNVIASEQKYGVTRKQLLEIANDSFFTSLYSREILRYVKTTRRIVLFLIKNKLILIAYLLSKYMK